MILFLALKLLLISFAASSLFILSGFVHQERKAKWKKLSAMASTRFVMITPDDLLFETCAAENIRCISGDGSDRHSPAKGVLIEWDLLIYLAPGGGLETPRPCSPRLLPAKR